MDEREAPLSFLLSPGVLVVGGSCFGLDLDGDLLLSAVGGRDPARVDVVDVRPPTAVLVVVARVSALSLRTRRELSKFLEAKDDAAISVTPTLRRMLVVDAPRFPYSIDFVGDAEPPPYSPGSSDLGRALCRCASCSLIGDVDAAGATLDVRVLAVDWCSMPTLVLVVAVVAGRAL